MQTVQAQKMAYHRTGEVTCTKYDQNTMWVKSAGQADKLNYAITYAELNAIENILFKGIPNSGQESAMIPNEMKAVKANAGFFNELLDKGGYRRYIMESHLVSKAKKKRVHFANQSIRVDVQALRLFLEQNKVIRKFGL